MVDCEKFPTLIRDDEAYLHNHDQAHVHNHLYRI